MQILTFELDNRVYGLPAIDTIEVVRAVKMASMSEEKNSGLDGVFDFRGKLVALLDIRSKFGMNKREIRTSDHFIIVKVANSNNSESNGSEEIAALRVDHTIGLVEVEVEKFKAAQNESNFIGVAKFENDLIVIYDVNKLMQGVDFSTLLN